MIQRDHFLTLGPSVNLGAFSVSLGVKKPSAASLDLSYRRGDKDRPLTIVKLLSFLKVFLNEILMTP
ncbi:hypothetical protein, partial [Cecembia lonarensis]|uniref:hypothetical protein n=1 Tax=Cecembia lonarensis TaxID=645110 RepID=UPI0005909D42